MTRFAVLAALLLALPTPGLQASQEADLSKRLLDTYAAAADWLVSQQDASGAWMMGPQGKAAPSPSYAALIVGSLAKAPEPVRSKHKAAVEKAVAFILSKANSDGSIGEGPTGAFLKTYTTGIVLIGLSAVERTPKIADVIRGCQAYLKNNQIKEGVARGGLGYGDEPKPNADPNAKKMGNLSVVGMTAEGLKQSGLPQDDEFWKLVIEFCRACQNNTELNTNPELLAAYKKNGLSIGEDGGLIYQPSGDKKGSAAGTVKIADKEILASYGSMTYDGIKTYLYAGLPKNSPEVKAAVDWVRKNWTLDSHPGFAFDEVKRNHLRGLYYYYLLVAKAMDAYGENPFVTIDGKKHDWAKELASKLLSTVKESKMWVNENAAWYESDPILVTSYVLLTCDILFKNLK